MQHCNSAYKMPFTSTKTSQNTIQAQYSTALQPVQTPCTSSQVSQMCFKAGLWWLGSWLGHDRGMRLLARTRSSPSWPERMCLCQGVQGVGDSGRRCSRGGEGGWWNEKGVGSGGIGGSQQILTPYSGLAALHGLLGFEPVKQLVQIQVAR